MYKQGTIVLVPFPFTDLTGTKVRPAIIMSHMVAGDDVVVVFISAQKQERPEKFDLRLLPSKTNNLKLPSVVKCRKIATLDKKIILGKLGALSGHELTKIKKNIKILFGI